MRNETEHFKLFDWQTEDWAQEDMLEFAIRLNWRILGDHKGEMWAEPISARFEMVFADSLGNFKKPSAED